MYEFVFENMIPIRLVYVFIHIYFNKSIKMCWSGFRLSTATGEQQYVKASGKYFAVALAGGGGPVAVCSLDQPGRFEPGTSQILSGHSGNVLDFDWNPFDDTMIATASEDTTIKLWSIPDDWEPIDSNGNAKSGPSLESDASLAELIGHRKKVTLVRFHPTAANVLGSTSSDMTVKVWDCERAECISSCDDFTDLLHDFVWDYRGDNIATSCKDKSLRIVDPRTGKLTQTVATVHEGAKSVKLAYVGDDASHIVSVGFSKTSSREMKLWDIKNLSAPIHTEKIDTASGAFVPLFDQDTNVLYLCGKGDGKLGYFEVSPPEVHTLSEFRSTTPGKGYCLVPKRALDVMKCESARVLKLTPNGVEPLSFRVPRKSEAFQDDIFPDTAGSEPAHSCEEWLGGSSKDPVKVSLDPKKSGGAGGTTKTKVLSAATLKKQLNEAESRIKYLEEKLAAANIEF